MLGKCQRRPLGGAAEVRSGKCSTSENTAQPARVKPPLVDALDESLCGLWPGRLRELFDPGKPRPLAIGIREQIGDALGLDRGERYRLGRLLGKWTGRPAYLKALSAPGARRYGLDGEPVKVVNPEHQAGAVEQLERARLKRVRSALRQGAEQVKAVSTKASPCRVNAARPVLRLGARG